MSTTVACNPRSERRTAGEPPAYTIPRMPRLRTVLFLGSSAVALACGRSPAPPRNAPPSPPPVATRTPPAKEPAVEHADLAWLEDVTADRALAFARAHNDVSEKVLTSAPGFGELEARLFAVYSSKDRIPGPTMARDALRNF